MARVRGSRNTETYGLNDYINQVLSGNFINNNINRYGGMLENASNDFQNQLLNNLPPEKRAALLETGLLTPQDNPGAVAELGSEFMGTGVYDNMGGLLTHTVWHGSPHKWVKPDISKVGTGEGAQAYGHGFYSAENPEIANWYKDKLSSIDYERAQLDPIYSAAVNVKANAGDVEKTKAIIRQRMAMYPDMKPMINRSQKVLDALESGDYQNIDFDEGILYKLDIPDEDLPMYLDWDKPLSNLSDEQQSVAAGLLAEHQAGTPRGHENFNNVLDLLRAQLNNVTGEDLHTQMVNSFKRSGAHSDRAAQEMVAQDLAYYGFPGIRYLDGSSRGAGQGTYNYVTFDPSRIKVLERNGILIE